MILGIDAFNIRAGGGVTHLVELLRAADPCTHGFQKVIIWGGTTTLARIDARDWLLKVNVPLLDRGLPYRVFWHRYRLRELAERAGCDVLFVPGGSDASGFKPVVLMSQNLLPFEWSEMLRYGWNFQTLKFLILRWTQGRSFQKANGVIFLTEYAREAVLNVTEKLHGKTVIVSHGINPRFRATPRLQRVSNDFTEDCPCRVLYVSIVDVYKHQWHVAEAVALLRLEGVHVVLELVGPPARGIVKLKQTLNRVDPGSTFITYRGAVSYEQIENHYLAAEISVFASSCETFGQILIEAMSAGLPIACSNRSAMPEVLGDAGIYFDPEDAKSIADSLRRLIDSPNLRTRLSQAAFDRAQAYSWKRCANETFEFLAQIARESFTGKNS
jgi:glycosyltransferase involved in cell wall biosynthesis